MNKKCECKLTFKNFYVALAYFFANIQAFAKDDLAEIIRTKKIKKVFLVPVWDTFSLICDRCAGERGEERVRHTMEFLTNGFCNPASNLSHDVLQQLENYFNIVEIPTPHSVLKNSSREELARNLFFQNRKCVEDAGRKLLTEYLRHREEDKTQTGECSKSGFGLVLYLDIE